MNLSERRTIALSDATIAAELNAAMAAYEARFTKVSVMTYDAPISFSSVPPLPAVDVFHHHEVSGNGDTAKEALADWRAELDKRPQSGAELMWRVPPEYDCWCDFPHDKLIWKVYARMVIIPEKGIDWRHAVRAAAVECTELKNEPDPELGDTTKALVEAMHQRRDVIAAEVLNKAMAVDESEPWGSPYAMNKENWT